MLISRTSKHVMISRRYDSLLLKAGAVCGSPARTDLRGGCQVTGIPTATNKVGLDVAIEALRETWRSRKATMDDLVEAACVDRVSKIMRPYLEATV